MEYRQPFQKARSSIVRKRPSGQSEERDADRARIIIPYNGPVQVIGSCSNIPSARARTRERPESGDRNTCWEESCGSFEGSASSQSVQHNSGRGLYVSANKLLSKGHHSQVGRRPGGRDALPRSRNLRRDEDAHNRGPGRERPEPEIYQHIDNKYEDSERSIWKHGTERPARGLNRGAEVTEGDWRYENQQPKDLRCDIERRRDLVDRMDDEGQWGNTRQRLSRWRVNVQEENELNWNAMHSTHARDEPVDDLRHIVGDSQLDSQHHDEPYDELGHQMDLRHMIRGPKRQRNFLSSDESYNEPGHEMEMRIKIGDYRGQKNLAHHDTSSDDNRLEMDWRRASDDTEKQRDSLHQDFAFDEHRHKLDWKPRTKEPEDRRDSRHHSATYDYQGGNLRYERQMDLRYRLARTQRYSQHRTDMQSPPPDDLPHAEGPIHHPCPVKRNVRNRIRSNWDRSRDHEGRSHWSSDSRCDFHRASEATEEERRSRNPRPYGDGNREYRSHVTPASSQGRERRTEPRRDHPHASTGRSRGREAPGTRRFSPRVDRTQASKTEREPQNPRLNITSPGKGAAERSLLEDLEDIEMYYMGLSPVSTFSVVNDSPSDSSHQRRSSVASGGPREGGEGRNASEETRGSTERSREGYAIDTVEGADSLDVMEMTRGLCQDPETASSGTASKFNDLESSGTDLEGGEKRETPDVEPQVYSRKSPNDKTSLCGALNTEGTQRSASQSQVLSQKAEVNASNWDEAPADTDTEGNVLEDDGDINRLVTTEAHVKRTEVDGDASHEGMDIPGDENDATDHSMAGPKSFNPATSPADECSQHSETRGGVSPENSSLSETAIASRSDKEKFHEAPAPSSNKAQHMSSCVFPPLVAGEEPSNHGKHETGGLQLDAGYKGPFHGLDVHSSSAHETPRQTRPGSGAETTGDFSGRIELTNDVAFSTSTALEGESREAFGDTSVCEEPKPDEINIRSLSPKTQGSERKVDGSGGKTSDSETRRGFPSNASSSAAGEHVLPENVRSEAPHACDDSRLTDGSDAEEGKSQVPLVPAGRENSVSTELALPQPNEQLHTDAQPDAAQFQVAPRTKRQAAFAVGPSHAVIRRDSNKESIEPSSHEWAALRKGSVSATNETDTSASCGSAQKQVSSAREEDGKFVESAHLDASRNQSPTPDSSDQCVGDSGHRWPASGEEDKGSDLCGKDSDVEMIQLYSDDEGNEDDELLDAATAKDWAVGAKATRPALPLQPRVLSKQVCRKQRAQMKTGKRHFASITSAKRATNTDTSVGNLNLVCDSLCLEETAATDLSAKLSDLVVEDRLLEDSLNDNLQSVYSNNSALTPSDLVSQASAMENPNISSGPNNTREVEELKTSETDTHLVGAGGDTALLAESMVASHLNLDDSGDGRLNTGEKSLLDGKLPLKITLMRHPTKEKRPTGLAASSASKSSPEQSFIAVLDGRNESEVPKTYAPHGSSLLVSPGEDASVSGMFQKLILASGEGVGNDNQRVQPVSSSVAGAHDSTGGSSSKKLGIRPPGDVVVSGREAGIGNATISPSESSSPADVEHQADTSDSDCTKTVSAKCSSPANSSEWISVVLESDKGTQDGSKAQSNGDLRRMEGGNIQSDVQVSSAAGRGGWMEMEAVKPKHSGSLFQELDPSEKPTVYPSFKVQLKKKSESRKEIAQERNPSVFADSQTEVAEVAEVVYSDSSANNLDSVPMDIDDDNGTTGGIECINVPSTPQVQPFYTASPSFPPPSQQVPNYAPFLYAPPPIPFSPKLLSRPPPPVLSFRPWLPASENPSFQVIGSPQPPYPPLPEKSLPPPPPKPQTFSTSQESMGTMQSPLESSVLSESSKTPQWQLGESLLAEGWGSSYGSSPVTPMNRPIPTLCEHRVKTLRASAGSQDLRGSNLIDLTPSHQKCADATASRTAESASYLQQSSEGNQQQKKNDENFYQDESSVCSQYQGNINLSTNQNNSDGSDNRRKHGNYGAREGMANQDLRASHHGEESSRKQMGMEDISTSSHQHAFPCKTVGTPGTHRGTPPHQQRGMLHQPYTFSPESAVVHPSEMLPRATEPDRLLLQRPHSAGDEGESLDVNLTSVKTQQCSQVRKSKWSESDNTHVMSNLPHAMESIYARTSAHCGDVDISAVVHQGTCLDDSSEAGTVGDQDTLPELESTEIHNESQKKNLEQQESNVQEDESCADHAWGRGKIQQPALTNKEELNRIQKERMLHSEGKSHENVKWPSMSEQKESNVLSVNQQWPAAIRAGDGQGHEENGCFKSVVKTAPAEEAPVVTAMNLTESPSRDDTALLPSFATEGNNSMMNEDENLVFGGNSPSDIAEDIETGAEGGDESEMHGTFEGESSQMESSCDAWEDKSSLQPSIDSYNDTEPNKTIPLISDSTWEGKDEAVSESLDEDALSRDNSADKRAESRLDSQSSKTRSSPGERQHRHNSKLKLRRKSSADKDRGRRPSHSRYTATSKMRFGVARSISWSSENVFYFMHGSNSSYGSNLKGFKIPKKKNPEDSVNETSISQQMSRKLTSHRAPNSGDTSRQVVSESGLTVEPGPSLWTPLAQTGFPSQPSSQDSSSDFELDSPFSTGRRGSQAGPSKVEDPLSPLQPPSKHPRNRIYDSDSDSELEDVDFLTKPSASEQNSSVSKGEDWDLVDFTSPLSQPRTFSSSILDNLVTEKRKEALEEQAHLERRRLLKEEIENKGKRKGTEDKPQKELELSEHQIKTLNALKMPETTIQDVHPGEKVFHGSRRQNLFTASLSPLDCGFLPGSGELDHCLIPRPDLAKSLIMSDVLALCSQRFSDIDTILNWVFLIMSVHEDALVVEACHRTLTSHLEQELQEHQLSGSRHFQSWAPPLHIVLRAFLNMGAKLESVLPDQSVLSSDQLREATMPIVDENAVPDAARRNGDDRLPIENLQSVLESLALLLQARPKYSEKELSALFLMVAKVAMDLELRDSYVEYELGACLENIVENLPKDSFSKTVPAICRQLCQMVEHHHNRVHLCSLLPKGGTACRIRQCFAFLALHQMLNLPEPSQGTLENIQVRNCLPLVTHLHQLLQHLYTLHSAVLLLDCSMSNLAALEPDSGLELLNTALQPLRGCIRETGGNLDASKVKNAMVKLSSKWTLLLKAYPHSKLFKTSDQMEFVVRDESEVSSPERKTSGTAEETLVETGNETEESPYIVDGDDYMLPDI